MSDTNEGGSSELETERKPRRQLSTIGVFKKHWPWIIGAPIATTAVFHEQILDVAGYNDAPAPVVQPADPAQDAEHAARIRNESPKPDGKSGPAR